MQKKVFLVVLIEHSFANIFSHVTVGNFRYFGVIVTRIEGIMIDIDRTNRFRRFLGLFKDLYSFLSFSKSLKKLKKLKTLQRSLKRFKLKVFKLFESLKSLKGLKHL